MAYENLELDRKIDALAQDSRLMADSIANISKGFYDFSAKFEKLEERYNKLEFSIAGNSDAGIKPVFDRVFDKIDEVHDVVKVHEKRITKLETCNTINHELSVERRKIFNWIAKYIFPTSLFTVIVAFAWKFICWLAK